MMLFPQEIWQDVKGLGGLPLYIIISLLALLFGKMTLFVQLVIGLALAFGVTVILRFIYFRERPDKKMSEPRNVIERIEAGSFPSLHAMRAAVLGTLLILLFHNLYASILVGAGVLGVAVARVVLKRHFFWDVIFGVIIGIVIAFASVQVTTLLGY